MSTEEKIMKARGLENLRTCPMCGKPFLDFTKRKVCKECAGKLQRQNGVNKKERIEDKEFEQVYNRYYVFFRKLCFKGAIEPLQIQYKEAVLEQCMVILWRVYLYTKKEYRSIPFSTMKLIKIYRQSLQMCLPRKDVPPNVFGRFKNFDNQEFASLDAPIDDRDSAPLMDFIPSMKIPTYKVLDAKNLMNKIAKDSLVDEDVACTLVQTVLAPADGGYAYTDEQRTKILKEDFGVELTQKQLAKKSIIGWKKLYSAYAPEIADILDIERDEEWKRKSYIKEIKTPYFIGEEYNDEGKCRCTCPVCGKVFFGTHKKKYCSHECTMKANSKQHEERRLQRQIDKILERMEDPKCTNPTSNITQLRELMEKKEKVKECLEQWT